MMYFALILFASFVACISATAAPAGFCSGKADGDYKHPNNCGEHIKCSNGMASVFDCPVNLVWDDNLKRCEFSSTDDPSCNTPLPFSCVGRPDGNYAYPGDCTKFYMCSNQIKWAMDCPAPTHFNPTLKVCDYQMDANCVL
ncbi:peritrophin-1-like [Argopecten irradians]|uniref:peritrophin-1-like n=1 Tax=Argopecten irradians TaxID=31199 RepID=UPI00371ABEA2